MSVQWSIPSVGTFSLWSFIWLNNNNDRLCTYEAIWSALLHNGNIIFYYYQNKASTSDKKQKPKKGDDKNEKVC